MSVRIERRGDEIVFVDPCDKPVATMRDGGIEILSKHSSRKCDNEISFELIEEAKRRRRAISTRLPPGDSQARG